MEIIELQHVSKTFGAVVAVKNLDLKVPAGTIYRLSGPKANHKNLMKFAFKG